MYFHGYVHIYYGKLYDTFVWLQHKYGKCISVKKPHYSLLIVKHTILHWLSWNPLSSALTFVFLDILRLFALVSQLMKSPCIVGNVVFIVAFKTVLLVEFGYFITKWAHAFQLMTIIIIWMHLKSSPASQTWMQSAVRHSTRLIPSGGAELKKKNNQTCHCLTSSLFLSCPTGMTNTPLLFFDESCVPVSTGRPLNPR